MNATRYKRGLLGLLLVLLLLPALQTRLHLFKEPGLAGAFIPAPHPDFSWSNLLASEYRPALEHYVEDGIGFRTWLIKLRNQLSFSLFHTIHSREIIVGQQGTLFQTAPVQAALGQGLLPEAEVRYRVRRLRTVQRDLARQGVQLLFVMAPNKARFEPELLPAYLHYDPATPTNYTRFRAALQADSVTWLDMVPLFARWKHTQPYPLFARGGTHWSGYGATLAADTLLRRLEQLGQLRLPTVRTVGPPDIVRAIDSVRATDNDLGWTLNLLVTHEMQPLAYRRLAFEPPHAGQVRPSVLLVGDSFTWSWMQFAPYIQREFADDTRFWYYNDTVYQPDTDGHPTGEKASALDLAAEIRKRRFIVVLVTEHNLPEAEFGFTNRVYHHFHPLTEADHQAIEQLAKQLAAKATPDEQWQPDFMDKTRARAQQLYEQHQAEAAISQH